MKVNFKKYFAILLMFFTIVIGTASWVIVGEKSFIAGQHSVSSAVAYIIGKESVKYTSIEKALDVAVDGEIVVVVPPKEKNYNNLDETPSNPDKVTYYITRDCEIKEGVSLVIPTDAATLSTVTSKSTLNTYITSMYTDDRTRGSSSSYSQFATANPNYYLRVTVEVADNVTVINKGTLVISGYLGAGTGEQGLMGHTSHSYSRIILGNNSKIIQSGSNSVSYCFGYIYEKYLNNNSLFELNNGTLYVPFIVTDYKGFGFSWAMTDGAINTHRCSPFNQIEFKNIHSKMNIQYLSSIYGYSNAHVSYPTANVNKTFTNKLGIVGSSSSFFIQFSDSNNSYIEYKYNETTTIADIKIFGGIILNNFELKLKESFVTVDLSTTSAYFPISYKFNIELCANDSQDEATFDISKQRLKLLPGSSLIVNDKCKLEGNEIVVYTAFYDGTLGNGQESKNETNPVKYPIKDGAILKCLGNSEVNVSSLAGTVYGTSSNYIYTNNTITAKEAWKTVSSGSVSPAWTVNDYLEIREKLQIKSLDDFNKNKIFAAINTFTAYSSFVPEYNIYINNDSVVENINEYQRVVFLDSISNYRIEFISNIYNFLYGETRYNMNQKINYSSVNSKICAINSILSITKNSSINEFRIQSISISCVTPEVNGEIPLFIGKSIKLEANIFDYSKIYEKTITWKSLDETIATVDSIGNVTGVSLGVVTITATCDGMTASYDAEVLEEIEYEKITSVYITDNKGNNTAGNSTASGSYDSDTNVEFTIHFNPSTAPYNSIVWTLDKSGTQVDRIYINETDVEKIDYDNDEQDDDIYTAPKDSFTIKVSIGSGSGITADTSTLTCVVTDLDKVEHRATFNITHNRDTICFARGTLVTMADGSQKAIENVSPGEMIISLNHETGKYEPSKAFLKVNHGYSMYSVMKLKFSDNTELKLIGNHGLYDVTLNRYVSINEDNLFNYIGHKFLKYDDFKNINNYVNLVNAEIIKEYTESYTLASEINTNHIINGLVGNITNVSGTYNFFEFDSNHAYDYELMKQDIEKYGLFTYEEFKEYTSEYVFNALNIKYYKVSIGKGYMTYEDVIYVLETYNALLENGELEQG